MNVIKMLWKSNKSRVIGTGIDAANYKFETILCYDNLFIYIFHI